MAEILSCEPGEQDGVKVDTWSLAYTPPESPDKYPDRMFVITRDPPYRLLEHSWPKVPGDGRYFVDYTDWVEDDGSFYPTTMRMTAKDTPNGNHGEILSERWTVSDSLDGLDEKAVFLSYYGFPEPEAKSRNALVFSVILIGLLIVIAAYSFRRRAFRE